jgi:hypothetical protein
LPTEALKQFPAISQNCLELLCPKEPIFHDDRVVKETLHRLRSLIESPDTSLSVRRISLLLLKLLFDANLVDSSDVDWLYALLKQMCSSADDSLLPIVKEFIENHYDLLLPSKEHRLYEFAEVQRDSTLQQLKEMMCMSLDLFASCYNVA